MVHPDVYETKQRRQEACVDKHIAPDITQRLQGSIEKVEAGTGHLGGIQRLCLIVHGSGWEKQSLSGAEFSEGHEGQ